MGIPLKQRQDHQKYLTKHGNVGLIKDLVQFKRKTRAVKEKQSSNNNC